MPKILIELSEDAYKKMKVFREVGCVTNAINCILDGQVLPEDCEILTKDAYADLCYKASLMDWTPCTVALPKKSDLYLVTWTGRIVGYKPYNWIELIEYTAADGDRKEAYGWETYELEKGYKDVEVLAWMEAPVEYKETKK